MTRPVPTRRTRSADLPEIPVRGASLLRKPSGTLFLRFRRGGRTKDVALDAQRPALAAAEAVRLASEWERGAYDPWRPRPTGSTLQDAGEAWATSDPRLAASTVKKRREAARLLTNRLGPDTPLARVTADDLTDVLYHKRRAASTLRGYHARLSTFFGWCVERRYLEASPMADVDRPRPEKRAPRVMTEAQLESLIRKVHAEALTTKGGQGAALAFHPAEWLPDWLRLGFYSGLRPGELRRLRWRDVDRVRGVLHVRNTAAGKTKTGSERVVPIYAVTAPVLDSCERRRLSMGLGDDDDAPVLPGAGGGLMNLGQVSKHVRRYRRLAKLPEHVVPYSTRHGYASTLVEGGVSARVVQERLGHADARMTARYVALVAEKHAREEGAFAGPATSALHPAGHDGTGWDPGGAGEGAPSGSPGTENAPKPKPGGVPRGAEHGTRTRDLHLGKVGPDGDGTPG